MMMLFWILFLAVVGWGLYRLYATGGVSLPSRDTPLEALQRRYAKGYLSTEEYEERKHTLNESDDTSR